MDTEIKEDYSSLTKSLFWLIWIVLLLLIPFYGLTLLFEIGAVSPTKQFSMLSPVIGSAVIIVQIAILVFAVKAYQQRQPLSKLYLILLGGSVLNIFVWAGGCALMGPLNLH